MTVGMGRKGRGERAGGIIMARALPCTSMYVYIHVDSKHEPWRGLEGVLVFFCSPVRLGDLGKKTG